VDFVRTRVGKENKAKGGRTVRDKGSTVYELRETGTSWMEMETGGEQGQQILPWSGECSGMRDIK